jgi:hypothetical protein
MARGDFITHLDDDDEYLPGRIAKLVRFAQATRAEFVWHPFYSEQEPGIWRVNHAEEFMFASVTTSAAFYHRWLVRIPWDINAWRYNEPGDWNRFRKLKYLGVRASRFDEPLLRHYREGANWLSRS